MFTPNYNSANTSCGETVCSNVESIKNYYIKHNIIPEEDISEVFDTQQSASKTII